MGSTSNARTATPAALWLAWDWSECLQRRRYVGSHIGGFSLRDQRFYRMFGTGVYEATCTENDKGVQARTCRRRYQWKVLQPQGTEETVGYWLSQVREVRFVALAFNFEISGLRGG